MGLDLQFARWPELRLRPLPGSKKVEAACLLLFDKEAHFEYHGTEKLAAII